MKYIVIDERKNGCGDMFTVEFENLNEAIEEAKNQWQHLTTAEKANRNIYVVESVNPDEEAEDYFDGNTVFNVNTEEE